MDRLVPSRFLIGLTDLVSSYGKGARDIITGIGLDACLLDDPERLLSDQNFNALLEACALACDDKFLLLKLARCQSLEIIAPANGLLVPGDTLGEVLEKFVVFNEQFNPGLSCHLAQDRGFTTLSFDVRAFGTFDPLQLNGQLHAVDHAMSLFCYELQDRLGTQWRPHYTLFQYASSEELGPLYPVFGEKLYFNQDVNALCFTEEDCQQCLHPSEQKRVTARMATPVNPRRQSIPLELRVDQVIRLLLNNGPCSAQSVAEVLGMKLRTLQHRLKQNNSSYQAQYNTVRLDLARYYLGTSELSISAVVERLRFTDSAAFSNFFREQTGYCPREYLQQVRKISPAH